MKSKCLGAATLSVFAAAASAQAYQTEISGGLSRDTLTVQLGEIFGGTSEWEMELDVLNVGGRWHFDEVNTEGHPLAEASFLQRSSSLAANYRYIDFSGGDSGDWLNLQLEYFVPNSIFYVAAHYDYIDARERDDADDFAGDDGGESQWGMAFGVTPVDGLLITTRYRSPPFEYFFYQAWFPEQTGYDPNLQVEYVMPLAKQTAVRLEASYVKGQSVDGVSIEDEVTIGGDYYINRTWSVGAKVFDQYETGYGLRTRKFFSETFSIEASYFEVDYYDQLSINVSYRI